MTISRNRDDAAEVLVLPILRRAQLRRAGVHESERAAAECLRARVRKVRRGSMGGEAMMRSKLLRAIADVALGGLIGAALFVAWRWLS